MRLHYINNDECEVGRKIGIFRKNKFHVESIDNPIQIDGFGRNMVEMGRNRSECVGIWAERVGIWWERVGTGRYMVGIGPNWSQYGRNRSDVLFCSIVVCSGLYLNLAS